MFYYPKMETIDGLILSNADIKNLNTKIINELTSALDVSDVMKRVPEWVEKWKMYIDQEKREDWEKYVNYSAENKYHWTEIDLVLKLLEMIEEWRSRYQIQNTLDIHKLSESLYGYSLVKHCVIYFSKKWEEAEKKLDDYQDYWWTKGTDW